MSTWWRLPVCGAAAMLVGCTRLVGGAAELPPTQTPGPVRPAGIDVGQIMLDTSRMRGITGAGEDLTIIPSMDVKSPVDIDALAGTLPSECRFVYAETATFGTEFTQFHKITFQYPPKGALISEGAAAYPDTETARRVFDALVASVTGCVDNPAGAALVGGWDSDEQALHTRSNRCGSDYLLKSTVLLEVTFCGFSESVSDLVITNLAANVPG